MFQMLRSLKEELIFSFVKMGKQFFISSIQLFLINYYNDAIKDDIKAPFKKILRK